MTPEIPFDAPPHNLELVNGETYVICASLEQPLPRLEQFAETLSADERDRAARFAFQRDRNRFVAGRGLLREILGWLLHADPAQLVFAYGKHGKPHLAAPVAARFVYFNLAHSDALAVYAVSASHEVGIDIERIRPLHDVEEIAARFFSARENVEWYAHPGERKLETFLKCWTGKEAQLKAIGCGLNEIQERYPSLISDKSATHYESMVTTDSIWFLHSLTAICDYIGTVATRSVTTPRCSKWPPCR